MKSAATLLLLLLALPLRAFANAPDPALIEAGRAIYERGVLPSGEPLRGLREGGVEVSGAPAACMQCHRRSGIGTTEGTSPVPTVTAAALFAPAKPLGHQPRTPAGVQLASLPYHARPPYTDATLARALREGVASDGRAFGFLMPRYALADADLAALAAYLRTLGASPSPGADNRLAHFATVIAPDTDPARRRQMTEVLNACFREQYPEKFTDPTGRVKPGERLAWRLHTWQLDGTPDTWEAQLAERLAQQPVFALVSGLAGETWLPVHRFCEANRLPCLFPNTDSPGESDDSVYSFYLYRGVMLEADVIAQYLEAQRESLGIQRVLQVTRRETAGQDGAERLALALGGRSLPVETRLLDEAPPPLTELTRDDALVLWLREADLAALAGVEGRGAHRVPVRSARALGQSDDLQPAAVAGEAPHRARRRAAAGEHTDRVQFSRHRRRAAAGALAARPAAGERRDRARRQPGGAVGVPALFARPEPALRLQGRVYREVRVAAGRHDRARQRLDRAVAGKKNGRRVPPVHFPPRCGCRLSAPRRDASSRGPRATGCGSGTHTCRGD